LLKYILAAAGQEDPGHRKVGPIHLIKYVYPADLIFANHFGPWAPEVYSRIEPAITERAKKAKNKIIENILAVRDKGRRNKHEA
jgi:hypothetical protein